MLVGLTDMLTQPLYFESSEQCEVTGDPPPLQPEWQFHISSHYNIPFSSPSPARFVSSCQC